MIEKPAKKQYFKEFVKMMFYKIKNGDLVSTGAMLAYFLLFSIFPFLMFFLNIIGFIAEGNELVIFRALEILPANVMEIIRPVITSLINSSSGTLLSITLIIALWSGSNGIMKLIREINGAFGNEGGRGFIKDRLLSIVFTVALSLLLILMISARVFGNVIINAVYSIIGEHRFVGMIWDYFRDLAPIIFMIIIFTLLYKLAPDRKDVKVSFLDALPGSIFTAIAWILISRAFAYYVDNFGNYDRTYGSLGGIIVLLTWLYLSSMIMILGAYISSSIMQIRDMKDYDKTIFANVKKINN